jgi:hypothetical protein
VVSEWAAQAEAAWERAAAELRSEGWEVALTCLAAPVQLEGRVPDGSGFYFRARFSTVSLGIGGDDPAWTPDWEREVTLDDDGYSASYLDAEQGLPMIRQWFAEYQHDSAQ